MLTKQQLRNMSLADACRYLYESFHGLHAAAPELAPTDEEYMAAWRHDFPQSPEEWLVPWERA